MTPAPVGFDLDMTLIDSQRAILAAFAGVAADTGVAIDPAGVLSRLGIKLQDELAYWFPPGEVEEAVRIYRAHYLTLLQPMTRLLPGAAETLAAVRAAGAKAVVDIMSVVGDVIGKRRDLRLEARLAPELQVLQPVVVADGLGQAVDERHARLGLEFPADLRDVLRDAAKGQHRLGGRLEHAAQRFRIALSRVLDARAVAVGMRVTSHPPHRSVRAAFPHTAPTSGNERRIAVPAKDGGYAVVAETRQLSPASESS